jgi:hypothetical protein
MDKGGMESRRTGHDAPVLEVGGFGTRAIAPELTDAGLLVGFGISFQISAAGCLHAGMWNAKASFLVKL